MPSGTWQQIFFIAGVLLVATFAYAIRAGVGGQERPELRAETLEVTDAEVAAALESLEVNATFASITTTTSWTVAERLPNVDVETQDRIGIALLVALATPVASSGPWMNVSCQGTVVQKFEFPYTGISALGAIFRVNGDLVSLAPLPAETLSYPPNTEFPERTGCPIGFEDEEN